MANYTPDPYDVDRPQLGDRVILTAELRGIKRALKEKDEGTLKYARPLQKVNPSGSSGSVVNGNYTIDFASATFQQIRIAGNCTINIATPSLDDLGETDAIVFGTVRLENGGNHTVNWNSNIRWPNGVKPVLAPNGYDVLVFFQSYPRGPWNGILSGANMRVPS